MKQAIVRIARYFIRSKSGVVLVWFGMTLPMLVSAVGVSLDLAQTYLVRERLSHAIDAAALAAASSSSEDSTVIERRVEDFIEANYPPDKIGFTIDIDVDNQPKTLGVEATARLNTSFMKIFGKDTVDVHVETEVTKEVKSIEVVLVMDVTGSMATVTGGKTRISTLISASKLFVNTMFERVKDKNQIKIGLVPYSSSVNVGTYGLGKTPANKTYDTAFVSNPYSQTYSKTDTTKWRGCILETTTKDQIDHTGPWNMYRYCRNNDGSIINGCDTTYNSRTKKYTANQHQNYLCPETPVTPMTNNQTDLLASIGTMKAEGNTYGNIGMVWGYRMISPEAPFREGVSWSNEDWKKAVILMTDGVNTMHPYYSVYGPTKNHSLDADDLDTRLLNVCDNLKKKNVLVYTITFDDEVDRDTKKLYEKCATQPSMWYDAPSNEKLKEVYLTIAKELANLHLSK